jgi:hypothetical protein
MAIVEKLKSVKATLATLTGKVIAKSRAFLASLLFLKLLTSLMAIPGLIYLLDAYGVMPAPKEMKVKAKFAAIGVKYKSPVCAAIMAMVGAGKIFIPINYIVFKGEFDLLFAIAGSIGFPLVIYSHRVTGAEPLPIDVAVFLFIVVFWKIYFAGKSKVD